MRFEDYVGMLGGFDRAGASDGERRAYDLGVRDNDMKLVEWRPYSELSDAFLIACYEKATSMNFSKLFAEMAALALFFYFMRPFFWVILVLMLLYLMFTMSYRGIRLDKLKRELRIRNKGKW